MAKTSHTQTKPKPSHKVTFHQKLWERETTFEWVDGGAKAERKEHRGPMSRVKLGFLYANGDKASPLSPLLEDGTGRCLGPNGPKDIGEWASMVFNQQGKKKKNGNNSSVYLVYLCACATCTAALRISYSKKTKQWTVKTFTEHSNCTGVAKPTAKNAAAITKKSITSTSKASDVIETAQGQGLKVSYKVATNALKRVIDEKLDPWSNGFHYLRSYLHHLELQNPGSTIIIETERDSDGNERFRYIFIQLNSMVLATSYCLPIMSYDCGRLMNPFWNKFQCLVAATQNGNHNDVLSSFSVCPRENNEAYSLHIQNQLTDPRMRAFFGQGGKSVHFILFDHLDYIGRCIFLCYDQEWLSQWTGLQRLNMACTISLETTRCSYVTAASTSSETSAYAAKRIMVSSGAPYMQKRPTSVMMRSRALELPT